MKKTIALPLVSCLLLVSLFFGSLQIVMARSAHILKSTNTTNSTRQKDIAESNKFPFKVLDDQLSETIRQYFEAKYESFTGLKPSNSIEKYFSSKANASWKALEELKIKTIGKINSSFNLSYDKFDVKLSCLEISIEGNSAHVVLEENTTITFTDPAILPLEFSKIKHELFLQKDVTNWKITNDVYEDIIIVQIEGRTESEIFDTIENNIVSQKKTPDSSETSPTKNSTDAVFASTYNRTAAVSYANTWKNGVNPNYWQETQDCTNFVSQAVYAGTNQVMSAPTDYYNNWYFDAYTKTGSFPWINVGGFYSFITSNSSRGPVGYSSGSYLCYLSGGDAVVMQYTSGGWRHAVLVTSITGSCHDYTKIQVASHTPFGSYNLAFFSPSNFYALNITGYNN